MRTLVSFCALLALVLGLVGSSSAAEKSPVSVDAVPLFEAMEAGSIEVKVIPRDSTAVVVQLKNVSPKPLVIQVPPQMLAAPILAQFQFQPGGNGGPFGQNGQNNNFQAPQQLGVGAGNNGGNFPGGNGGNQNQFNGGLFRVPEGKVVRLRFAAVCLDHGKPDPSPRHPYELQPITNRTDDEVVHAALKSLGDEDLTQQVAQLVAWHQVNDKSWNELSKMTRSVVAGVPKRLFSTAEVEQAKAFCEQFDQGSLTTASRSQQ